MYILSSDEKRIILKAFSILSIEPTRNVDEIKSAFRSKAVEVHPDKASSEYQSKCFHDKFIELVKSRDICLKATTIENLIEQLANLNNSCEDVHEEESAYSQPVWENPDPSPYENEWESFVTDLNAYSNIFSKSSGFFSSIFVTFAFSLFFSLSLTIIVSLIITGLVAAISASIAIPILGWIGGIFGGILLVGAMGRAYEKACYSITRSLSSTGHPYKAFILGWVVVNIATAALFIPNALKCDWIILIIYIIGIIILIFCSTFSFWLAGITGIIGPAILFYIYGWLVDERSANLTAMLALIFNYTSNFGYFLLYIGIANTLSEIQKNLDIIRKNVKPSALVKVNKKSEKVFS